MGGYILGKLLGGRPLEVAMCSVFTGNLLDVDSTLMVRFVWSQPSKTMSLTRKLSFTFQGRKGSPGSGDSTKRGSFSNKEPLLVYVKERGSFTQSPFLSC